MALEEEQLIRQGVSPEEAQNATVLRYGENMEYRVAKPGDVNATIPYNEYQETLFAEAKKKAVTESIYERERLGFGNGARILIEKPDGTTDDIMVDIGVRANNAIPDLSPKNIDVARVLRNPVAPQAVMPENEAIRMLQEEVERLRNENADLLLRLAGGGEGVEGQNQAQQVPVQDQVQPEAQDQMLPQVQVQNQDQVQNQQPQNQGQPQIAVNVEAPVEVGVVPVVNNEAENNQAEGEEENNENAPEALVVAVQHNPLSY